MTFFQSFEWNKLLLNQFRKQWKRRLYRKVQYGCVFEKNHLVVIAPLRIKRLVKEKKIIKEIELLGSDSFSDYVNLIYSDAKKEYFDCLIKGMAARWKDYEINWSCIPQKRKADNADYCTQTSYNRKL
jgi:hypothetical protein